MKRLICLFVLTAAVVVATLILFSPRASAITYGFVDSNNTFRNTGAFIVKDPTTGEIMRIVFDGSGTYAVVRSPGWTDGRLVLEGDARSAGGTVRVRETIRTVSENEFTATWEALRNGSWSAYSIERATRRGRPA